MNKIVVSIVLSSLLATGCASTASNQQKGAGIGALVGAVVGKGTGDHGKNRYVWGAALGAIAGAAIGGYMDQQEEEFREELADSGVGVYREGDDIRLSIPGNITFSTGSSNIVPGFYPILGDVSRVLNKYGKTRLSIEGHTDNVGDESFNQSLSVERSNSVAKYLASVNVAEERLQTVGFGESRPLNNNQNEQQRRANRRVELRIIPVR